MYTPRGAYVERGFTRDLRLIKARVLINLPPGGPEGGGERYQHFEEIFGTLGATFFQSYIYTHPGSHTYTQVRIYTPRFAYIHPVRIYTPRFAYIHPGGHIYTQVRIYTPRFAYTQGCIYTHTQVRIYTPRGANIHRGAGTTPRPTSNNDTVNTHNTITITTSYPKGPNFEDVPCQTLTFDFSNG